MTNELEQDVHEALDNALDNGHTSFLTGNPLDIATDMCEYAAHLERYAPVQLIPFIQSWQSKQGESA